MAQKFLILAWSLTQLARNKNLKLLEQFIDDYNGAIYHTKKTGVCQQQQSKILVEIEKARDLGLLTIDQPFVEYDYSKYNR